MGFRTKYSLILEDRLDTDITTFSSHNFECGTVDFSEHDMLNIFCVSFVLYITTHKTAKNI